MYPNITQVKPQLDYSLVLTYDNKEVRQLDMKPLLDFGIFRELRDYDLFKMVHVCFDTIEWDNENILSFHSLNSLYLSYGNTFEIH